MRAIEHAKARPTPHDDVTQARLKRARAALQARSAAPTGHARHAPLVRTHLTDVHQPRYDLVGIDADDLERVGQALIEAARVLRPATRGARAAAR